MSLVLVVVGADSDRAPLVAALRFFGHDALETSLGPFAVELARSEQPDLIIAEIVTPSMDAYELVRELRADSRTAATPVIFQAPDFLIEEAQRLADACGVSQVIVKPSEPVTIGRAVDRALAGPGPRPSSLPPEDFHLDYLRMLTAKLLQHVEGLRAARHRPLVDAVGASAVRVEDLLSPRELEVLAAIAEGATNADIGNRLVIAETTVQSHVRQILRKLGAKNRTQAAARYFNALRGPR